MQLATKRATATVSPSSDPGEFDILLSNDALDRHGEQLHQKDWRQLPQWVPINVNHSDSVTDVVGSGRPYFDSQGNLRVKGAFADTDAAQHVRALVAGGHVKSVSVEFLRHRDGTRELIGGAFVSLPANPAAQVLSAKAFSDAVRHIVKSGGAEDAFLQAIHDASVHLGAGCLSMDGVDGAADGANKGRGDITDDDEDGDDYDYEEKAALALQLRMKAALRR